ncbi:class I SAM-dependent methyltransferase [Desulfitobacterium sp.]|uniref:class I SAM-dependent methyltransferase n=1 Tax=Desulfitobacterium sp. TaxID=49981 RepID=UPI002B1F910D|nr:class I SAM-dependent methyltransferase [Desulfitobacterium sp.]MEA4900789.1 class I SAM-dependent methyltransferase [Desulfitobacterium sp.]
MSHKFDPAHKDKLRAEWRTKAIPPVPTLQKLGLRAEDCMADIGCGIGYFTIPATEIVDSTNQIYALDTSEEMLAEVENRLVGLDVANVIPIKTGEYDLKLPDESVSFALMVTVLHEVEDKERFICEAHRILKPSGRIAVVDWEKKPTKMGPPVEHRLSSDEVIALLKTAGLEVSQDEEYHFAEVLYGIVAIKN